MKIVKILGGLGNQMFQYALYLSLKKKFPKEEVMIDLSCFRSYPLHNGFELDKIFTLDYQVANWRDIAKVAYPYPNYRCWQIGKYLLPKRKTMCVEVPDFSLDETVLTKNGDRYFDGYWQHDYYFNFIKEEIHEAFTFPTVKDVRNKAVIDQVQSDNSVAIHIRCGDYINHPFFRGICSLDYYKIAIEYMKRNVHPNLYCIFSDDIGWCQKNLMSLLSMDNILYVDWNKGADSFIDMQIMSSCKHNIIANSSFSWWGAWLNRNHGKVVLAPKKWMNIETKKDPVPNSWMRI